MTKSSNFKIITEGTTEILILPQKQSKKGPGTKQKEPFYNPAMELNRDLSILVNQWFVSQSKGHVYLLDGLAAAGIRGVRLANEVDGDFDVTINDWNEQAFSLIKKNVERNKLKNITTCQKDLNVLLSENRYHFIDIDPFGSPVFFVDSALRSVYNNGVISCTATDTATLCGTYPKVCLRRYGARPLHSPVMKEIGLRILLGFLCREAAKYDGGIAPLISYSTDHYFRVYVKIRNGKDYANSSMKNFSIIDSQKIPLSSNTKDAVGPLWLGRLHNKEIIQELRTNLFTKTLNTKHELWKLLSLLEEEADAPPFFYTAEGLASELNTLVPKREHIFEKLQEMDYKAMRTHFSPTGFKTNASPVEIKKIFKELQHK